ncbi:hypothetical protein Tco_1392757 [Tanacetum coccineum]
MSELPDDAIGIYHEIFDSSSVRIPFSLFLLSLIKHYRIEPTVALFRVFQTLCKQGDWFSFSKSHAPSSVCIDDNRSHPSVAIDDPRPAVGSFSMSDVRRLSAHVIKLRDMPEGVLVLSGLSRVWKSRVCDPVLRSADGNDKGIHDFLCLPEWTGAEVQEEPHHDIRPTLQRLPFYCTPPAAADAVIPDPTPEDLVVGTPSVKILAKNEASQKRKASTFGVTSSHVAKCTKSWHLRLLGQGIMVDDAVAPSAGASRPRLYIYNYTTTALRFGKRSLLHSHQLIHQRQHTSYVGEVFSISHFSSSGRFILASTHLRNLYISKKIPSQCRYRINTLGSSDLPLLTSTPTILGLDTSS